MRAGLGYNHAGDAMLAHHNGQGDAIGGNAPDLREVRQSHLLGDRTSLIRLVLACPALQIRHGQKMADLRAGLSVRLLVLFVDPIVENLQLHHFQSADRFCDRQALVVVASNDLLKIASELRNKRFSAHHSLQVTRKQPATRLSTDGGTAWLDSICFRSFSDRAMKRWMLMASVRGRRFLLKSGTRINDQSMVPSLSRSPSLARSLRGCSSHPRRIRPSMERPSRSLSSPLMRSQQDQGTAERPMRTLHETTAISSPLLW